MSLPGADRLETALEATWPPAAVRPLGPFLLRDGAGGGRRVSAATALGAPTPDETDGLLAAMGGAALVRLRPGEEALDAALAARGLAVADPTVILAAPAATVAAEPPELTVLPSEAPLAAMAAIWAAGGIGPERLAVMARVRAPCQGFLLRLDDRPAGCAFAAAAGDIAMVHALYVDPRFRRRGGAAWLVRGAARWAAEAGAATVAAATVETNAPARALFAALGFAPAHRYWYRVR